MKDWTCDICGKKIRNAMFMVRDDLWLHVMEDKRQLAHHECFELKLGRSLVYSDYTFSVVNDEWTGGMRLPCAYCLFIELEMRYTNGLGMEATWAKLKLIHHREREWPKTKMIIDRCTCDSSE